eukprot:scaffold307526_cov29-Prasinocladus_malaysianus.AAC.1
MKAITGQNSTLSLRISCCWAPQPLSASYLLIYPDGRRQTVAVAGMICTGSARSAAEHYE